MTSFPVASPATSSPVTIWSQGGAASSVTQHLWGWGVLGKNTWFRLCWSTLDRRSSTTLTLLPSSYTTTTVPVIILQTIVHIAYTEGTNKPGVQIINKRKWLLWRGVLLQLLQGGHHHQHQGLTSQTSEYGRGWSGPVRFNLN